MTDEDSGSDLDLEAYRAPAAPAGLADRVIARVHAADQAVAASVASKRKHVRRWLFTAGVATVLVAGVLVWDPWGHAAPPRTSLVATLPGRVELEGVIGNADPGANLEWQRSEGSAHVAQRAGSVTWSVAANHHLSVDVGAAVASIEATNSTFRVEARMNLSDVRTVGVTAVTAASVALVTIVVYEGHVKVSGAGQTVIVNPGTTMTVEPGRAPVAPITVGGGPVATVPASTDARAEVWITAGESATVHDSGSPIVGIKTTCAQSELIRWATPGLVPTAALVPGDWPYQVFCDGARTPTAHGIVSVVRTTTGADQNVIVIDSVHQSSFDRQAWPEQWQIDGRAEPKVQLSVSGVVVDSKADGRFSIVMAEPQALPPLVLRAEHPTRGVHYYVSRPNSVADVTVKKPESKTDSPEIARQLANARVDELAPKLRECGGKQRKNQTIQFRIEPDGSIADLSMANRYPTGAKSAEVIRCFEKVLNHQFSTASSVRVISYTLLPDCDAEELKNQGADHESRGDHAGAIVAFEQALQCKADAHVVMLAFMSSCNGGNLTAARTYWKKLTPSSQQMLKQMALRAHWTQAQLDAP